MWRRSPGVPETWRVVDDRGEAAFGRGMPPPDTRRLELWRLTLEAKNIPHRFVGHGTGLRVFVPALWEGVARAELAALKAEEQSTPAPSLAIYRNAPWALLAMAFLLIWHGLRMAWWPLPFDTLPDPDYWIGCGKLDVYRVLKQGEWWRLATSLTLHADSQHLFGNLLFGAPFFILLARRLGIGPSMLLTLLAGMLGNAFDLAYQPYYHSHVGFSTALFGIVGLLCADTAVRDTSPDWKRRFFLPLAAGMGLLAMLGADGEHTDYTAHICGLLAGFLLGAAASSAIRLFGQPAAALRGIMAAAVPVFLLWTWNWAFA